MKIFVYGGSETLGEHILRQLNKKGHEAVTIAQTDNRAEALEQIGEVEVIIEGEGSFMRALDDADAIIYIAGASPGTGEDQDALIDHEAVRSEEHTSELQSRFDIVCRLLLEKKNIIMYEHQNKGLDLRPRTLVYPIFGKKIEHSKWGVGVDDFCIFGADGRAISTIGFCIHEF